MKKALSFLLILLLTQTSLAQAEPSPTQQLSLNEKIEVAKTRCTPRTEDEPYFYMDMFDQSSSPEQIDSLYKTVYSQNERLYRRAGYDKSSSSFITKGSGVSVAIPEAYLKTVIQHVENALRLKYVKHIFFSDMGHSHLLVPAKFFNSVKDIDMGYMPSPLNLYLKADGLKSLYHTAEHYKFKIDKVLIDNWYVQWRFFTRNLSADANGNLEILTNKGSFNNTVNAVPGYHWSAGFSISANKNGCFPFEDASGQIQYFDISAWDPIYACAESGFCHRRPPFDPR